TIEPRKGFDLLVRATERLSGTHFGIDQDRLGDRQRVSSITERVRLLGHLRRAGLAFPGHGRKELFADHHH
ncbi:hypothetical protein ABZX92_16070, partial [Lentzea sp. NPDC006480]|uniref:hypothetical protein n=1 Tax=Lentzea sp. NPDC006480 TaxID=3157176 RepID=UPI0033A13C45